MSNVKKYLSMAQSRVNENYLGVDGFVDDANFAGEGMFEYADAMMPASAPTSQPYIIKITGTSIISTSTTFEILNAYTYINAIPTSTGIVQQSNGATIYYGFSLTGDLVAYNSTGTFTTATQLFTISSQVSGVTYRQFLYQSMNNPFNVGLTYIKDNNSGDDASAPFSLTTKDASGNIATRNMTNVVDPYQYQTTVIANRYAYAIDGYTGLIFSQLSASKTMYVYFYPSDNINSARALVGRPVSRGYANPQVIKSQPIKISK